MSNFSAEKLETEAQALGFDFSKLLRVMTAAIAVYKSPEGKELLAAIGDLVNKEETPVV